MASRQLPNPMLAFLTLLSTGRRLPSISNTSMPRWAQKVKLSCRRRAGVGKLQKDLRFVLPLQQDVRPEFAVLFLALNRDHILQDVFGHPAIIARTAAIAEEQPEPLLPSAASLRLVREHGHVGPNDYHDFTAMAAARYRGTNDVATADYNLIRNATRYQGPRKLLTDTADALAFNPACASVDNSRGALLPASATLAMFVV